MRGAAVLVVAAVGISACGGTSPPPALEGRAPAPAPTTPAPSVTWQGHGFATPGLPAIAGDGRVVVYAARAEDGGRGNPNLAIVVVDRGDVVLRRVDVLDADDADQMIGDGGPGPALEARIASADRALAELHAAHDLRPLPALVTAADPLAPEAGSRALGGGLALDLGADRLRIRRDHQVVVDRAIPRSWLVEDRPMCAGCAEICTNPAYLGAAHGDGARALVLLTISYAGTDTCWEPSSQHHVVAW